MTLSDLPEIQITRHLRATRLRLKVDATQIRLTVPQFCTQRQIQQFLNQSEAWLLETWQKQQTNIQRIDRTLPDHLHLFNLDQPIQIIYQTQKKSFVWQPEYLKVLISDRQPTQYLKAFIIAYAKTALTEYLQQVSQDCALPYGQCSIRQPKTRWGSCTSKHGIMLNAALVLFPEAVARYVCVHELAHTRHFDHSPKFWTEVAKYDAHFQQHRKLLKTTPLPYWWYESA